MGMAHPIGSVLCTGKSRASRKPAQLDLQSIHVATQQIPAQPALTLSITLHYTGVTNTILLGFLQDIT